MQYEGVRQEHVAVRTAAGLFDVSHMGEIETRGRARQPSCAICSPTTSGRWTAAGAVLAPLPRRTAACSTTSSRTASPQEGEDRYLTVVNASNAESDFDWFRRQAEGWEASR